MLTLLSPAKSLDYDSPLATKKRTQPRLLDQSEELIDVLRAKSVADVRRLMDISEDLAVLNVERYQDFTTPFTPKNARPAVLAFAGDVYHGMDAAKSFGERDFTEANKTVRILSGLYGVLRPLDLMQPYRLEMGTKLATDRGGRLYDFWGGRITDQLNTDLAESPGSTGFVNLASNEYFSSVQTERLDGRLITPRFLDQTKDGSYQVVAFWAKHARGAMAGWIVRERIRSFSRLREFDLAGYRYDPTQSSSSAPVFLRDHDRS